MTQDYRPVQNFPGLDRIEELIQSGEVFISIALSPHKLRSTSWNLIGFTIRPKSTGFYEPDNRVYVDFHYQNETPHPARMSFKNALEMIRGYGAINEISFIRHYPRTTHPEA